jgi:hypothetical protein
MENICRGKSIANICHGNVGENFIYICIPPDEQKYFKKTNLDKKCS